ncbi:hypothetical protein DFH06DRAFT_591123 [Mycena polygramma]|nr:hypothetical protein DFH06DRAFT_591123 [Mycena polygramma]
MLSASVAPTLPSTLTWKSYRSLINIVKGHRHDEYRQGADYSVFENSPSLRNFTLISTSSADPVLLKFVLPWTQLTHLCIEEPLFFVSMMVLVRCINLVQCTFGTMEPFDDEEDVALQQCTTFPFLTEAHFSFGLWDSPTADNFLAPLILPSLKKLVLQSSFNVMEWSTAAFDSFQLRSAFLLEELELHRITLQSEELHGVLESLSTLKALTLSDLGNAFEAVRFFRLITWDASNPLLPHLKQLKTGFIQSDTSLEPCIAMVRSRRKRPRVVAAGVPTASRLERLHFVSYKATSPLDRWWWPRKFERLFPKMELKFECTELR